MNRIRAKLDQRSMRKTLKKIAEIDTKIAKRSVKDAVKQAGAEMLKKAKSAAPKGKTGLFRRTLGKRDRSYGRGSRHIAVVGQRFQASFPPKTQASARRKNFGLSTGLSGKGLFVPIHLIENRTRPHVIRPKKSRGPKAWLAYIPSQVRAKNGRMRTGRRRDIIFAKAVRHPGTTGTRFLKETARRNRFMPISVMRKKLESDLRALGGSP